MKKLFSLYSLGWLALLGLFNVIIFLTPSEINGVSKFDTLFWVAYAFITLTFIGHLICLYFILKIKSLHKTFYSLSLYNSLFKVSVIGIVIMSVVGSICMAVIQIPDWIGIIVCCAVLVVTIIAVVKATIAINLISDKDEKIKNKTLFIKMLTADADALMKKTTDPEMFPIAKKVYEAIRYSDPMANETLISIEDKILEQFYIVSNAISDGDVVAANDRATQLQDLLNERNAKCKILK